MAPFWFAMVLTSNPGISKPPAKLSTSVRSLLILSLFSRPLQKAAQAKDELHVGTSECYSKPSKRSPKVQQLQVKRLPDEGANARQRTPSDARHSSHRQPGYSLVEVLEQLAMLALHLLADLQGLVQELADLHKVLQHCGLMSASCTDPSCLHHSLNQVEECTAGGLLSHPLPVLQCLWRTQRHHRTSPVLLCT